MVRFAVLGFLLSLLINSELKAQNYDIDGYTVDDGLALNQVLSVFQDSRGYMWMGTNQAGISVFDGKNFKTIQEKDGLANDVIYSFLEDKKGRVFIGTNGGLSVFDGFSFKNYTTKNGLTHDRVFSIMQDKQDRIWLSTMKGVSEFKEDTIVPFVGDSNLMTRPIFASFCDREGVLWFGTIYNGLAKVTEDHTEFFSVTEGLGHSFVRTIAQDREGRIWVGTGRGVNVIQRNGKIEVRQHFKGEFTTITSSKLSKDGDMWFASESGIYVWNNDSLLLRLKGENGLQSSKLMGIAEDSEGNMWFGSDGKGVIKFNYHSDMFSNYDESNGIYDEIVKAIYEDDQGRMWFGAPEGVSVKDPITNKFKRYYWTRNGVKIGLAQSTVDVLQDYDGRVWFASRKKEKGLNYYDEKRDTIDHFESEVWNQVNNQAVNCLTLTEDSAIWGGMIKGVFRLKNGEMTFPRPEVDSYVWDILMASDGKEWYATDHGVAMYNNGTTQFFNSKDGLTEGRVRTIIEDKFNKIWFATNKGLYRYDGQAFKHYGEEDGLATNTMYSVLEDSEEDIWYSSARGIGRIYIDALELDNELKFNYFGLDEGFMGLECNSNSSFMASDGKLWFGTVKGATIFDPEKYYFNDVEPKTYITDIRFNFTPFDWSPYSSGVDSISRMAKDLEIPFSLNHLTFDFIGISHHSPNKVRYQFKLEPLDETWLPVTEKNEATYPHLPAGNYTLHVKAMNEVGIWNKEPVTYSFTVLPPWYQTWWFYTLIILAIGSGFYAFIVIRTKNLKKQKEILEKKVEQRTSELREEKEKVEQVNKEVFEKNHIIEEKNKDIFDSINYAKRIQEALLPSPRKIGASFLDHFVLYSPKDIVSGDFYWFGKVGKRSYIAAVDCTGHGVPGAFMSMIGHNLLNQIVLREHIEEPGAVMTQMNNNLKAALQSEGINQANDGMDMCLCVLVEEEDGQYLEYAGANNPLWVVQDGELSEIKANKWPIGGVTEKDYAYDTHRYKLEKGVTYYICSDGYQDQFGGPKGKKFMKKKMKQMLVELEPVPLDQQRDQLHDTLFDWMGRDHEQVDDVLVIGLRF